MENKRIDNLSDVSAILEDMLQRISTLEKEIAFLKGESITEEAVYDDSEAIDLSLDDMAFEEPAESYADSPAVNYEEEDIPMDVLGDDFAVSEPEAEAAEEAVAIAETVAIAEAVAEEAVPEPVAEPEAEPEIADMPEKADEPEPEPEPEAGADDFSNLFGSEFEDIPQDKPKRGRRPSSSSILNDASSEKSKAVMDVLADKCSWLHDLPGAEVKSLRSAIALGDQVLFIRRLFREDSALYQDTVDKLNSMTTLKEAVEYISGTFPEWDTDSEDVYRFMMAVRRKIRK